MLIVVIYFSCIGFCFYKLATLYRDLNLYSKRYGAVLITSKTDCEKIVIKFETLRDSGHFDRVERNLIRRWKFKPYWENEVRIYFDTDETKEFFLKCGLLEKFLNDSWRGLMSVEVVI